MQIAIRLRRKAGNNLSDSPTIEILPDDSLEKIVAGWFFHVYWLAAVKNGPIL